MENSDFFYVPDELNNKSEVKHLIVHIICGGLLLFVFYAIFAYTSEFPITEYLGLYALLWLGLSFFLFYKFLTFHCEIKPEVVFDLLKDSSDSPKLKDTILNILKVNGKIRTIDIYRILYVLQEELSGQYVKNNKSLIGIEKDQEAEILAKGEKEVEGYRKCITVLENTLHKIAPRKAD